MASDNASSVAGLAIRLTRLQADGNIVIGPSANYVTKKFVSLGFTPEYETGDEFTTKAADGSVCVSWKAPDTLKRVTLSIALCDPDPEFTEMIAGGTLLTSGGKSIGWKAPLVGVDATPNGVGIEVWSIANVGGRQAATNPYWHWIFPYTQMHSAGERAIQNDLIATSFEGWGVGNPNWKSPAAPLWNVAQFGVDSPVAYARAATIPVGTGYQTSA
ncbi:hypothetical protein SEA_ATUIN_78 [Arthrobacter phage Atuin]|nr:hypothetical protein SEA_ATUIN_177 [Arthrobacter phage Atuin]